ncbi:MAG: DUF4238 domain-containing protein [Chlamydiota bacterium]|nr:DUF4238 domain-containing protein [Chlamydiota bacterium]
MGNRVVKQHYISKCYLDSFSIPDKKKNILWVRDSSNRWRKSQPKKEAFENDFQTLIDDDGNRSDDLEKAFAQIEGDFKTVISEIEETRSIPKNLEKLVTLLSVMGLFAVRIPTIRERFKNIYSEGIRKRAMFIFLFLSSVNLANGVNHYDGYHSTGMSTVFCDQFPIIFPRTTLLVEQAQTCEDPH